MWASRSSGFRERTHAMKFLKISPPGPRSLAGFLTSGGDFISIGSLGLSSKTSEGRLPLVGRFETSKRSFVVPKS